MPFHSIGPKRLRMMDCMSKLRHIRITAEDFIDKHSSEYPKLSDFRNVVLIGCEINPNNDPPGVCVFQVPNPTRGGADAVVVVHEGGVWIRGLDDLINKRVAEAVSAFTKG